MPWFNAIFLLTVIRRRAVLRARARNSGANTFLHVIVRPASKSAFCPSPVCAENTTIGIGAPNDAPPIWFWSRIGPFEPTVSGYYSLGTGLPESVVLGFRFSATM